MHVRLRKKEKRRKEKKKEKKRKMHQLEANETDRRLISSYEYSKVFAS